MSEAVIIAVLGLLGTAGAGLLATPWLTRRQIRKAAETSNLEATDEMVRKRVAWLTQQFEDLSIEHQEIRTELHAERAMRRITLAYLQRLYAWAKDVEPTAPTPLPAPPVELADRLED